MSLFSFRAAGEGVPYGAGHPAKTQSFGSTNQKRLIITPFTLAVKAATVALLAFTCGTAADAQSALPSDETLDSQEAQIDALQKTVSKLIATNSPVAGLDGVNVTDAVNVQQLDTTLSAPKQATSTAKPIAGGPPILPASTTATAAPASANAPTPAPKVAQQGAGNVTTQKGEAKPANAVPASQAVATVLVDGSTTAQPAPTLVYAVSPADQNFRTLLKKWADREGWGYDWTLAKDVPIVGSDPSIPGPFKSAVRTALRSTEMTAYPVKPCFYDNKFLRVVKYTTKCDPAM